MLAKWHLAMPVLTACLGYFPGRRLGWLEDAARRGARLEFHGAALRGARRAGRRHGSARGHHGGGDGADPALSVTDDEFGTEAAIDRLLAYYTGSARTHLRLSPASMGLASIGHFAFFHERFRDTLWPIALGWLTRGQWAPLPATPIRCDCAASLSGSPSICA